MATLTWHRGSILPFASLWHTVRRAAGLNCLRIEDLPTQVRKSKAATLELLFNDGWGVEASALAEQLGEEAAILRWSNFGHLPAWTRFLIVHGIRVCPVCMAQGFHSALFSLRPLRVCPIHGCNLWGHCTCGRPFSASISRQDLLAPQACRCGRLGYYTRETCRRPALAVRATEAFVPIARWLTQIVSIHRPRFAAAWRTGGDQVMWLRMAQQWSNALGIGYPSAFVGPETPPTRTMVLCESTPMTAPASRGTAPTAKRRTLEIQYWNDRPSTYAYRAIARHLRRHVTRRSEWWGRRFVECADPVQIAEWVAGSRDALLAFAEMLWMHQVEPTVELRRWLPEMPYLEPDRRVVGRLELDGLRSASSGEPPLSASLLDEVNRWIEFHAAGEILLTQWKRALERAIESVRSGIADWEPWTTDSLDLFTWAAKLLPHGQVRFVGFRAGGDVEWLGLRQYKEQRRQREALAREQAEHAMRELCEGSCLTWTPSGGWFVGDSVSQAGGQWKIHRLRGLGNPRPRLLLICHGDRFVARALDPRIQVEGATAAEAFEHMRSALGLYSRRYGRDGCAPPARVLPAKLPNDFDRLYKCGLSGHRRHLGFWRGVSVMRELAEVKLRRVEDVPGSSAADATGMVRLQSARDARSDDAGPGDFSLEDRDLVTGP